MVTYIFTFIVCRNFHIMGGVFLYIGKFIYALQVTLFFYKQLVYKQLGLELQKVKQLLGLKHVTISNYVSLSEIDGVEIYLL